MDYYKILNVDKDSSLAEIKRSYENLSAFYNPSNNTSKNAYKKYREINQAYRVLSEIKQREMYNLLLDESSKEDKNKIDNSSKLKISDYLTNIKNKLDYSNLEVDDSISFKDVYLNLDLPYLYYLTKSNYLVSYNKKEYVIDNKNQVCPTCHGIGKVNFNNKVCECPDCLNHLLKGHIKESKVSELITINDENITLDKDDYKVFIKINFIDKEFYRVKNNEIFINYDVKKEEYFKGVSFNLIKDDISLNITSNDYSSATYTFLDYIIHINYNLTKYNGRDKEGYILTNLKTIYLNTSDYSYSENSDSNHTLKVNLSDERIVLEGLAEKGYNASNGNLIINVIRVNNTKDNFIFFSRKIKKVSYNLFKFKGRYNNHYFKNNKGYEYDDNYIYLPSKAYKLKLKYYSLFKIVLPILYLIIPIILYLILGFNLAFVISCIVISVIYLVVSNILMEVKG